MGSWALTGFGALCLAFVFSRLSPLHPTTGGPYVFVQSIFGKHAGFYVAWTYWILAWVGLVPVLGTTASSLCILFSLSHDPWMILTLQIGVLSLLTLLNLKGVRASGQWEVFMTLLKIIPLVIFPLWALWFFNPAYLMPANPTDLPWHNVLGSAALVTLWGFLGVESGTTPASSVDNPQKTIPRAIILGTLLVVILYMLNSVAVMGVVPRDLLLLSPAPYGLALHVLSGAVGAKAVSFFVVIVCLGAANAWIMAAGQVAKGAADDGLFPAFWGKENRHESPYIAIGLAFVLLVGTLFSMADQTIAHQIKFVVEISVVGCLAIYFLCVIAFMVEISRGRLKSQALSSWVIAGLAFVFCAWTLWAAGLETLLWASTLPCVGILFHFFWRKRST